MKARPILFAAPMVLALLAGTKSQTRRSIKPQPSRHAWRGDASYEGRYHHLYGRTWRLEHRIGTDPHSEKDEPVQCPYGEVGDLLWVRESGFELVSAPSHQLSCGFRYNADGTTTYNAPHDGYIGERRRPSIHMPRWASRVTLRITDVRVQQLKEIDGLDALAEGITREEGVAPWRSYMRLWNEINGEGAWQTNPFVWALTFEVIKANVDSVLKEAVKPTQQRDVEWNQFPRST